MNALHFLKQGKSLVSATEVAGKHVKYEYMSMVKTVNKIPSAFVTALIGYYGDFSRSLNAFFSGKNRSTPQIILRAN